MWERYCRGVNAIVYVLQPADYQMELSSLIDCQIHRRFRRQGSFASSQRRASHPPREASHGGNSTPGLG
jgi:hypothetical protein